MDLFTYGTLQCEEVWRRVAGVVLSTTPAVAEGFAIRYVRGQEYPGIIPEPNASTPGLVYFDVDTATLARLDAFESSFYERRQIEVKSVEPANERRICNTYVVPPTRREVLSDEHWTLEAFISGGGLERFTARYAGFSTTNDREKDK